MAKRRRLEDISADELLIYDLVHQRWLRSTPDQILDEAATLFNLAVFLARNGMRAEEHKANG